MVDALCFIHPTLKFTAGWKVPPIKQSSSAILSLIKTLQAGMRYAKQISYILAFWSSYD